MKLSNNKKRKIGELLEQAKAAVAAGRIAAFDELCRRIEGVQQGNPDVANLRAIVRYKMGRPGEAEQLFTMAIQAMPTRHEFHQNLGALYLEQKRYAQAADCYGRAIKLGNKALPVQLCYCKALVELGHYEQALPILNRLHKQHPRDVDVLMGLYMTSEPLNLIEEAEGYLQQILGIDPNHVEAHAKMSRLAVQKGRMDEAEAEARKALAIQPNNPGAYDILTYAKKFRSADDPDIAAMTNLYERSTPDSEDRQTICFALGKVLEQLKQYDRAFELFAEGNGIRHKKSRYEAGTELANMGRIMAAFIPESLSHTSSEDDPTTIFIVGMPRCGSTLVEQILAAHPDVESRGECNFFASKALSSLHSDDNPLTPEQLAAFTPKTWDEVARNYLEHLKGNNSSALRITDKTLTNFRHVGAIHCALPMAKIVHVRRHPLDTCLSIFKHHLQGFMFDYGYDLSELGDYYSMYLKLMQHWRDVLPKGVMYELDYENLIADQEKETRKLLEYCGLSWDEACLQFNKTKNAVRTASMAQVRRPIYADSQAAWKRYKKQLKPLIRILGKGYPRIR